MAEQNNGAAGADQAQFTIQKIYVKDVSFEVPGAPQVFNEPGQPQLEHGPPVRAGQLQLAHGAARGRRR